MYVPHASTVRCYKSRVSISMCCEWYAFVKWGLNNIPLQVIFMVYVFLFIPQQRISILQLVLTYDDILYKPFPVVDEISGSNLFYITM